MLTPREREILIHSLKRWIDIEATDGNLTAARLLRDRLVDIERERTQPDLRIA